MHKEKIVVAYPIMPFKSSATTVTSSDRQKSSKSITQDAQKSVATSPKKLRRNNSMKLDLPIRMQKMKSAGFVVGPVKKRYESLKCESGISGSALEKTSSSETQESKKSQDEMDIYRGFYA